MKVYLHSASAEKSTHYVVNVAPAGDTDFVKAADILDEWKHADGRPKQFEIVFKYGAAEVPDALGKYMVAPRNGGPGIAHKHRDWLGAAKRLLGLPAQLVDARGKPIEAYSPDGEPVIINGNIVQG